MAEIDVRYNPVTQCWTYKYKNTNNNARFHRMTKGDAVAWEVRSLGGPQRFRITAAPIKDATAGNPFGWPNDYYETPDEKGTGPQTATGGGLYKYTIKILPNGAEDDPEILVDEIIVGRSAGVIGGLIGAVIGAGTVFGLGMLGIIRFRERGRRTL